MAQTYTMSAELRDKSGKGTARAARREDRVPAVIYGNKQPPVMITLAARELGQHMAATFFTHIFDIKVGNDTHRVIPRDVQFHPVKDRAQHVDFLRISDATKITLTVPVETVGADKSPGIKLGGLLNIIYHELEVRCLASQIPEHITIDVSNLNVGDAVHLNDIKMPDGVEPTMTDVHATVITIATPSALRSKGDVDADAATQAAAQAASAAAAPAGAAKPGAAAAKAPAAAAKPAAKK